MLERLADFIQSVIGLFQFWVVIDQYEEGILLRLGKYKKDYMPGFHLIIPFGIDRVLTENIALESKNLGAQSLTTKDGYIILVSIVLSFRIKNIRKFLIEVERAEDVLMDSTYGVVGDFVSSHTWEEIISPEVKQKLYDEIRKKAFRWGIEVVNAQFADLSKSKTIRLVNTAEK